MKSLIIALAVAVPASLLLISSIFVALLLRCCKNRASKQISHTQTPASPPTPSEDTIQAAISKFHLSHKSSTKPSLRFHQLHHQQSHAQSIAEQQLPPPFSWQDHPRLISEAVESGWTRFAFTTRPAAPRMSPLWGLCGKPNEDEEGLITWETPPDSRSTEFMQTVRINPGAVKKSGSVNNPLRVSNDSGSGGNPNSSSGFIRMGLPLPGPPLVGTSFPQEAYFEIGVLYLQPLNREAGAAVGGDFFSSGLGIFISRTSSRLSEKRERPWRWGMGGGRRRGEEERGEELKE